jgi:hypothetical protein
VKPLIALVCALCCVASSAFGHALGESYIFITVTDAGLEGRFEFNMKDLRNWLGVTIAPGEEPEAKLRATAGKIQDYIRQHASVGADGKEFPIEFTGVSLFEDPINGWAQYAFKSSVDVPPVIDVRLDMLFEFDRRHRNLALVERNQKTGKSFGEQSALVFSPENSTQRLDPNDVPHLLRIRDMVKEGVWHIWLGIDHILFILAFLFPTVLVWNREKGGWDPVQNFPRAFANVLTIVTVFTVAHSVTLGLAAFDYIRLSSRIVESAIALSIILVALGNRFGGKRQVSIAVIFCLGLFHGLGFASVLGHLPFRMVNALRSVLLFNVGVELGQMAIVAALFPLLFLLRKNPGYPTLVIRAGSAVLVVVAGYWFIQRAFALG